MPIKEITGERPSTFSKWHRAKLPKWCLMTDGDFFIPVKKADNSISSVTYMEEIHEKMKIPSFIVFHNEECTDILVFSFSGISFKRRSCSACPTPKLSTLRVFCLTSSGNSSAI